ncbi:MAG: hypothetical protein RRA15_03650 [bacterium]|nr:hypothetical protein [bacterium]MDT8365570.1 hypothetical protein [bacterium]
MKRRLLQFVQHLAASVFIGISVYGVIIYYGGEIQKKIPVTESLLLGFGAVVCIVVLVVVGGIDDRMAAMDDINGDTSP